VRVTGFLVDVHRTKVNILIRAIHLVHTQGIACELVAVATVGNISKIDKFEVLFENNTSRGISADTSANARFRLAVCRAISRNCAAPRP
jgi:hypothetical protein